MGGKGTLKHLLAFIPGYKICLLIFLIVYLRSVFSQPAEKMEPICHVHLSGWIVLGSVGVGFQLIVMSAGGG